MRTTLNLAEQALKQCLLNIPQLELYSARSQMRKMKEV